MFSYPGRPGQAGHGPVGRDEEGITLSDRQNHDAADAKTVKVTDRRMFTSDGELREEFRHLEDAPPRAEPAPPPTTPPPSAPPPSAPPDRGTPGGDARAGREQQPEPPRGAPEPGEATFFDLVSLLAEHASIYLQQASVPDLEAAQNLEMAKIHIDLLAVLKEKTSGNLDREEQALLEDVLYRLRLAFTSQRGL